MLGIAATPDGEAIVLTDRDGTSLRVEPPVDGESLPTTLSRVGTVRAADPAAGRWLSERLGSEVRLGWLDDPRRRSVSADHGGRPGDVLNLADAGPLLLASTASLRRLDDWIAAGAAEARRGAARAAADGALPADGRRGRRRDAVRRGRWRRVQIGEVSFRFTEHCDRCVLTTIDTQTLAEARSHCARWRGTGSGITRPGSGSGWCRRRPASSASAIRSSSSSRHTRSRAMKNPDVPCRCGVVSRNSGRFGWANCGHSSPSGSTSRPRRVDDRLVLVGVQRADRVDDRAARARRARPRRGAARAGAPGAACARQRRSGRRPRTPRPEHGASTSARSKPLSASSRTSAFTTRTFVAPRRRAFSSSSRARPGCTSTAVTSPRSIVALPPGAAQASRTRSPSREPSASAASCEPRLCGQMRPAASASGSTRSTR